MRRWFAGAFVRARSGRPLCPGNGLCTPIWSLALLGLRGALTTDARNEFAFADYLAVRWISSAVAMIAIAAAVLLGDYGTDAVAIILLVAAAKLFENLSDIFHGRLQQHERMDRVAVAMAIRGLGGVALMFPAAAFIGSPVAIVAAFPLAMGATFFFWDLPSAATLDRASGPCTPPAPFWRTPLRLTVLGRLSIVALPIAISGFLVSLIPQLPKYVIGSLLGAESVAVYSLIAYWITLGMTIVTALGNTVTPAYQVPAAGEDRLPACSPDHAARGGDSAAGDRRSVCRCWRRLLRDWPGVVDSPRRPLC